MAVCWLSARTCSLPRSSFGFLAQLRTMALWGGPPGLGRASTPACSVAPRAGPGGPAHSRKPSAICSGTGGSGDPPQACAPAPLGFHHYSWAAGPYSQTWRSAHNRLRRAKPPCAAKSVSAAGRVHIHDGSASPESTTNPRSRNGSISSLAHPFRASGRPRNCELLPQVIGVSPEKPQSGRPAFEIPQVSPSAAASTNTSGAFQLIATSLLAYEACSSKYIFAGGPLGSFRIAASWRPRLGPPASSPGHGSARPKAALGR